MRPENLNNNNNNSYHWLQTTQLQTKSLERKHLRRRQNPSRLTRREREAPVERIDSLALIEE